MSEILVTGGAGFIGSHVAEYYAKNGDEVIVLDNLSRAELLGYETAYSRYNWNYLKRYDNIKLIKGDIRDAEMIKDAAKNADVIIHTAAQTAVTTSLESPKTDFEVNAIGTFNVLEAAKLGENRPCVIFCSTNKVYGDNVNSIPVIEKEKRYEFAGEKYKSGILEDFPTDLCEHSPYGCSKFAGDIYVQDYAQRNEINAAVFRMSCIYGTRQFGVEDQGWIAWFTIATLLGKPITIYGDGKQVRDALYVADLVRAFDAFIQKKDEIHHSVFNIGGGKENVMSLLELLDILEDLTGKKSTISFGYWRPSDQKVYISNITKAKRVLGWRAKVHPKEGVRKLVGWVEENKELFV